jgi:hypothetical protein
MEEIKWDNIRWDNIRTAQYFKVTVPDKPGEGARLLGTLRDAGINLVAFSGFPRARRGQKRGQIDFVPSDPDSFKAAAKQAKLKVEGPKTCFLVDGDDRPGKGAELMGTLAEAKINVTALQAICTGATNGRAGRYGAIFWVKPRDVKKTEKILSPPLSRDGYPKLRQTIFQRKGGRLSSVAQGRGFYPFSAQVI